LQDFCVSYFFTIYCLIIGGKEKFAYVGLFDGYNGKTASSLCREHLHDAILLEMSKLIKDMNSSEVEEALINRLYTRMINPLNNNINVKDIGDVYHSAYLKMDHLLSRGMHETSSIRWSGTSVFTAVIVANDKIEDLLVDLEDENEKIPIIFGHIHIANCGKIYMI
jgi:serine/threonine protein phosphatase PrpC